MSSREQDIDYLLFIRKVEDFLYREADLLDERRFDEWLDLFAEDIRYWMPMRKNLPYRLSDKDITDKDDIAWFDDDKETLQKRVKQISTGIHWAEEPQSRVSHLVSNIRLDEPYRELGDGDIVSVKCHFLIHRNRLETESDFIAGRRTDVLRKHGDQFRISQRSIIIDQSVLLAKNLTFFF